MLDPGEVLPYISHGGMYRPKGYAFAPFGLKTGIDFPILVRNQVWFSRELRECINVSVVSIPNE